MAFSVNWYIKDEIVYVRYSGATTGDELRDSLIMTKEFIESSSREFVHVINDVSDVTEALSVKESMAIVRDVGSHPRAGWTFSIGVKSSIVKMGSGLGASIFKLRYRAFDTLEQALAHLRQFDQRISWDKVEIAVPEL
ncbi:MAG: hypothetical protein GC179_31210 [Anaerolineaceae bacterium]|nr:hypothetical protein [Anaerolineaceae bacterium]